MFTQIDKNTLFNDYYSQWIKVYKEGAIRNVTMKKYRTALEWLKLMVPSLRISEMDRIVYQKILNSYAKEHERQTTMDFHHLLKGAVLDAVEDGMIAHDPTRKVIIKGKPPSKKKPKYLSQFELQTLLNHLELGDEVNWDWLILLIAKTGLRFSEALGLTPRDFDFSKQTVNINKTWAYKEGGGFQQTKNLSSNRKIQIDWQLVMQFAELTKNLPDHLPIFVHGPIYNSTANDRLAKRCQEAGVPVISIHGLRHTHASILLFSGVNIASVARRLGHASMTTTQKTYLHVIRELDNQDLDIIMRAIANLQ